MNLVIFFQPAFPVLETQGHRMHGQAAAIGEKAPYQTPAGTQNAVAGQPGTPIHIIVHDRHLPYFGRDSDRTYHAQWEQRQPGGYEYDRSLIRKLKTRLFKNPAITDGNLSW
jgi:hypothetical protein